MCLGGFGYVEMLIFEEESGRIWMGDESQEFDMRM